MVVTFLTDAGAGMSASCLENFMGYLGNRRFEEFELGSGNEKPSSKERYIQWGLDSDASLRKLALAAAGGDKKALEQIWNGS